MTATERAPAGGFQPPTYPYDRLGPLIEAAGRLPGGAVDLSIGTPNDAPLPAVAAAMAGADNAGGLLRGYPPSIGTPRLRTAITDWFRRRLDLDLSGDAVGACIGTKEFVATVPQWLKLRRPGFDTVLYPALSYPTYEMGALLAQLRPVSVPVDSGFRLRLDAIDPADAARALLLWVNSPGNPAGQLEDLEAAAAWGRARGVPVFSDECYVEFTWDGPPRTVLSSGTEGVVAVHSLSKRSNLAGARLGWYAGDAELVAYLREVRKHAGMMVPGPVQLAGAVALDDDDHVGVQRLRYRERLERLREILAAFGVEAALPQGGFYLWVRAPGGDAWAFATWLATYGGLIASPGEFYGAAGTAWVRMAVVEPTERLELVAGRLAGAPPPGLPSGA